MPVRLLETTIRDGGYEISHQFTEEDVALVVSTLDAAGVSYIEIGHGMGVGSHKFSPSTRPKERPVANDLAHMATARATAKRAKVGVIYTGGDLFCPVEYLDEVAAAGMDFVRLAFMPNEVTVENMRYVERARKLGMLVSINLMQTYVLSPSEIGRRAAMCQSAGAEWFYVVDSAGGMPTSEIRDYVRAVLEATTMEVGLHAHNNLGMAVANSLAAVEAGATLLDSTLNGLGRATGNPPTEQLILALQRMGHELEIDIDPIAKLSSMYRVLFEDKGNDPMHFVSGASMLHSRNVPAIIAQAKERGLSVSDFLVRVGREAREENCLDKFAFPTEVFDRAAKSCRPLATSTTTATVAKAIADRMHASEENVQRVSETLGLRSARYHLPSVLHLVDEDVFPFDATLPWQSSSLVGATVRWREGAELSAQQAPSYVLVDHALAGRPGLPVGRKGTFACSWDDVWSDAIRAAVTAALPAGTKRVWMPDTTDAKLRRIADRLTAAGFELSRERPTGERAVAVVRSDADGGWLPKLQRGDIVVIADRGNTARGIADSIRQAGAQALAPPVGAIVAGRAHEMISLTSQLAPLLSESGMDSTWVHPLLAPGREHAVIDVGLSTIIDCGSRPRADIIALIADARARTLTDGTGRP